VEWRIIRLSGSPCRRTPYGPFPCLLSLENMPTRIRRTDQLTILRAYSGNGPEKPRGT